MKCRITLPWAFALSALVVLAATRGSVAHQGTVVKWAQGPILSDPGTTPPMYLGEDFPSDIDWRIVPMQPPPPPPNTAWPPDPNWNVADDFQSDGRPVLTVRWWGSYFSPDVEPRPNPDGTGLSTFEDGYVLSFFRDIPLDLNPAGPFSQPGELLGTYVAPISAVRITPLPFPDWNMHPVYEYEVNLQDTHLFHPSDIADPDSFNEVAGEIYWLSVVAENGAEIDPATWEIVHNDDPVPSEHFWGWLTRPHMFNDVPTMSHLWMPPTPDGLDYQWIYDAWQPIQGTHVTFPDMSFELLTVPEPASAMLLAVAAVVLCLRRKRS